MHIYPLTRRVAGRVAVLLLCALIVASGPGGSAPVQAAPARLRQRRGPSGALGLLRHL